MGGPRSAEGRPEQPDAQPTDPHSYETFAQHKFIQAVDADLARLAPPANRILDSGTGTGAMIQHLFDQGKVKEPFLIVGVDIDNNTLRIARRKFYDRGQIHFFQASSEALPLTDSSMGLVIMGNAIHLTHLRKTLAQAYRVLKEGGVFLANTAYEATRALPPATKQAMGIWVSLARRYLTKILGYTNDIPNPLNLLQYKVDDFEHAALAAGFRDVEILFRKVLMDSQAFKAIGNYGEFARGALPGVPLELATTSLDKTVDPMFERLNRDRPRELPPIEYIPRNWMFLKAQK